VLRKDREILDRTEILDVLNRCQTLRIAFLGEEYPYIVPVSFGIRATEENVFLYFHGSKRGHKVELIEKSPKVCIEGDIFYMVEDIPHGITARYESVIGTGIVEMVEGNEMIDGVRAICEHYDRPAYPIDGCRSLPMTAVYRISLKSLTGKRNLPAK